ncbi:MAG: glycosyltransferase, partial [Henriciella sp.]|uniref:glycosyltransferase n=1 Tax=Henriciella sp. TaxID=1968823 RepID=UPI003C73A138
SDDRLEAFSFFNADFYAGQLKPKPSLTPNELLLHFFRHGIKEERSPHPLIDVFEIGCTGALSDRIDQLRLLFGADNELTSVSTDGMFDPVFYRRKHGHTDVHPVIHYLRYYHEKHLWPHPLFDSAYYSRANKLHKSVEPFSHFKTKGLKAGARPNPYFDPKKYERQFGQHFLEGESAMNHYVRQGHMVWFEPSDEFGQRFYLQQYPDIAERGEAPLLEFLHSGASHGRSPLPPKPFFDRTIGLSPEGIIEAIKASDRKMPNAPRVSVIVPAYQSVEYTLRCVLTMLDSADKTPFEIIIADDKSPDGSGKLLKDELDGFGPIRVLVNKQNLGFLKSCNQAAKSAKGDYVFFLNNDTAVIDGWLDELVATFERCPEAGLVGSKLVYPNGLLQEAGGIIWSDGSGANYGRMSDPMDPAYNFQRDVDYISGAAILIPKEFWDEQGGFSEELAPAYYEDTDFAMKTRAAGRRVIYQPLSTVVHYEGISSGTDITSGVKKYQAINQKTFLKKWKKELAEFGEPGDLSRKAVDRQPKARILIFDAEVPKPDKDSGSITAFNYVSIFCDLGYRVTFVPECLKWEGKYSRDLQRLGAEVLYAPSVKDARQYVLDNGEDFDLFILSRVTTGGMFFNALKELYPEKPVIFDTVDIHHLRLQRQSELSGDLDLLAEANRLKEIELATCRNADATIVVSDYEVGYLRNEIGPFPSVVIPLIYEDFERKKGFKERTDIAFIGGYRHPPNIDAVHHLVEDVWPAVRELEIDARLHIIGSHMPHEFQAFSDKDINVVGFVEDLESYLENIRLTIAPLRYGAGVKGKVGNSLRMGVPVVATRVAAEGMGLVDGEHILVADNTIGFAQQIGKAYADEKLWEKLSVQGQNFALGKYGIGTTRAKLQNLVQSLTASAKSD